MNSLPRILATDEGLGGEGRFFEAGTNNTWRANGVNYVKLDLDDKGVVRHRLFSPDFYDAHAAANPGLAWDLHQLRRDGYNYVRVFIQFWNYEDSTGSPDDDDPDGLNEDYMDRVAQFIEACNHYGLYVQFILDYYPQNDHYKAIAETDMDEQWVGRQGWNTVHMSQSHIRAKCEYLKDFITNVYERIDPALNTTILAWSIENEMHFRVDEYPFSKDSQDFVFQPSPRAWFNMADPKQRQNAVDWCAQNYIVECIAAIRSIDTATMISTGLYTYEQIESEGPRGMIDTIPEKRRPVRPDAISRFVSFLGIHTYRDDVTEPYDLDKHLTSVEFHALTGPWVLEEFGAYKSIYPTAIEAAHGMVDVLTQLKQYENAGWCHWAFAKEEQENVWSTTDDGGKINYLICPRLNEELS